MALGLFVLGFHYVRSSHDKLLSHEVNALQIIFFWPPSGEGISLFFQSRAVNGSNVKAHMGRKEGRKVHPLIAMPRCTAYWILLSDSSNTAMTLQAPKESYRIAIKPVVSHSLLVPFSKK